MKLYNIKVNYQAPGFMFIRARMKNALLFLFLAISFAECKSPVREN